MQRETIDEQGQKRIAGMAKQNEQELGNPGSETADTIHDIYVLIVREREDMGDTTLVVDSSPVLPQKPSFLPAYAICGLYLLCFLATIAFQLYCISNPEIATVTIIPTSQHVVLSGTLQLGRVLSPLTLSQSQTAKTTGTGHQDAKEATGTVTFYNGQQTSQRVTQGTVFTGSDGVSIETTQQATIPPGNPSTGYGTVTIPAQAVDAGSQGNIREGYVNTPIALAVFVKNNQFSGGQNERDFQTVVKRDIDTITSPLTIAVAQGMQGALQSQIKPGEVFKLLPCAPTVTSDHHPGQEAPTVKVTVSQTCSAIAYNSQTLEEKATAFLAERTQQKAGTGYSLFGTVHVSVKQASVTHTPHNLVFVSFQASGTWVYALSQTTQQQIKHLIAGKTTQQALQLVVSLPGVEHAAIRFTGFGDAARLPKNTGYIHLTLIVL